MLHAPDAMPGALTAPSPTLFKTREMGLEVFGNLPQVASRSLDSRPTLPDTQSPSWLCPSFSRGRNGSLFAQCVCNSNQHEGDGQCPQTDHDSGQGAEGEPAGLRDHRHLRTKKTMDQRGKLTVGMGVTRKVMRPLIIQCPVLIQRSLGSRGTGGSNVNFHPQRVSFP